MVCRCAEKFVLSASMCVPKIVSLFCGIWFIMSMSLVLMGSIRGLLPLVGVMLRVFCSVEGLSSEVLLLLRFGCLFPSVFGVVLRCVLRMMRLVGLFRFLLV